MGIGRSTFYDAPDARASDAIIVAEMKTICDQFEAYGYRRVDAELRHRGIVVNACSMAQMGRPLGAVSIRDRADRLHMAAECRTAFPKVLQFWLEALEAKVIVEKDGQKYLKYNVDDQFQAAKNIVEYAYGRPVQPIATTMQEQTHRTLEVRWMPSRPDDHSKCVDLQPGE